MVLLAVTFTNFHLSFFLSSCIWPFPLNRGFKIEGPCPHLSGTALPSIFQTGTRYMKKLTFSSWIKDKSQYCSLIFLPDIFTHDTPSMTAPLCSERELCSSSGKGSDPEHVLQPTEFSSLIFHSCPTIQHETWFCSKGETRPMQSGPHKVCYAA